MHLRLGWLKDHGDRRSLAARFRAARWRRFSAAFPELDRFDVLDIGGTADFWIDRVPRPRTVTITNLASAGPGGVLPSNMRFVEWSTFDPPPAEVTERPYDLVHSNSVIEHVGGPIARREFAEVVSAMAPNIWIQTPNRYFPIEPHWVFPFFQFLPRSWKMFLDRTWPLAYGGAASGHGPASRVDSVDLLSAKDLRRLFPDAVLVRERFLGSTKSLIAWRRVDR
ncbi:MAG: class I SAM-dependent methyltransferase [Acidimicrobiia bacterium]|nr:class I SAM-dependent methyltransferase [Acidimicrobiia bacterium]